MPTNEESSFVSPLYLVDTFEELQDLKYSDLQYLEEYRTLKMRKNDGEVVDEVRLAELELLFQNKIVTSSRWNKFQNALLGMQGFIKNEVQDYVVAKQGEMQTYADTKKTEVQIEIDKFKDIGIFNPSILYYTKNFVTFNDGTGSKVYVAIANPPLATEPTNITYWRLLSIVGSKGDNGNDGVGLVPKGTWSSSVLYAINEAVQFGGLLFASLINDNIGNQPDITQDTSAWGIALDVTITTTKLRGYRTIASFATDVNFMTGEIIAFNPNVDVLEVFVNTTALAETIDYVINPDNQSIHKVSGSFVAGTFFDFRVTRNQINSLVFSDGQSIEEGTVSKNKLTTDIQDTLDEVAENTNKISVLMGSSALVMTSTQDGSSRTTNITYTRSDASTYKTIDYSNFDANNKPQTVVTKLYSSTSVLETTNTATVVWSTDGTYVISSSEVIS